MTDKRKRGRPKLSETTFRVHVTLTSDQYYYLVGKGSIASAIRFLIELDMARNHIKDLFSSNRSQ